MKIPYLDRVPAIFKNFYFVVFVVFAVWMLFFDQNNLFRQIAGKRKFNALEKEKEYYGNKIEDVQKDLKSLRTDKAHLEKFAREKYLMKADDEDVFVIVKEKETK